MVEATRDEKKANDGDIRPYAKYMDIYWAILNDNSDFIKQLSETGEIVIFQLRDLPRQRCNFDKRPNLYDFVVPTFVIYNFLFCYPS